MRGGRGLPAKTTAQINARHWGCLMSTYKHLFHHRFQLSWHGKPGVAALEEGGVSQPSRTRPAWWGAEPCASGSRFGLCGTQDAAFPWARWSRGSANRTTIFSIHRCSSESSLTVWWDSSGTKTTSCGTGWFKPEAAHRSERGKHGHLWCVFFFTYSLCVPTKPPLGDCSCEEKAIFIGWVFFKIQNKTYRAAYLSQFCPW